MNQARERTEGNLETLFRLQHELEVRTMPEWIRWNVLVNPDPHNPEIVVPGPAQPYVTDMVGKFCTALTQELCETRDWTPWSPRRLQELKNEGVELWSPEHVKELQTEVIDAVHFLLALTMVVGLSHQETLGYLSGRYPQWRSHGLPDQFSVILTAEELHQRGNGPLWETWYSSEPTAVLDHLPFVMGTVDRLCTELIQGVARVRDWTAWKHWSQRLGNKADVTMWSQQHLASLQCEVLELWGPLFALAMATGMGARGLYIGYCQKHEVNHARQDQGGY